MPQADANSIWATIDRLSRERGWSVSHLAKLAGMDSTAFNKSKRVDTSGKTRTPNTDTLIRTAEVLGLTMAEFFSVVEDGVNGAMRIPMISDEEALDDRNWEDNGSLGRFSFPRLSFPQLTGGVHFAIRLTTDALLPVYRKNAVLVMSPEAEARAEDRVGVKVKNGYVFGEYVVEYSRRVVVSDLKTKEEVTVPIPSRTFIHRISWASQ